MMSSRLALARGLARQRPPVSILAQSGGQIAAAIFAMTSPSVALGFNAAVRRFPRTKADR